MSFDLWNCSPTCQMVRLVTQVYKKILSCSSSDMCRESVWPKARSCSISATKTCQYMPSSQHIHCGWPVRSSKTHACLVSPDVWYGSGSLRENVFSRVMRALIRSAMIAQMFHRMARRHCILCSCSLSSLSMLSYQINLDLGSAPWRFSQLWVHIVVCILLMIYHVTKLALMNIAKGRHDSLKCHNVLTRTITNTASREYDSVMSHVDST